LIKIIPPIIYAASVIIGFGAAILWVAQGAFITKCSDKSTLGRNNGIFWGIFQLSGILGNLSAFWIFKNKESSEFLFSVLLGCSIAGFIVLLLLRAIKTKADFLTLADPKTRGASILELIRKSFGLMVSRKDMLLMLMIMFYSGFELSYFSGEFPLLMEKNLIGAVMSVFGASEVVGGVLLGKLSDVVGRKSMMVFAYFSYCSGLFLSWIIKIHPHRMWLAFIAAIGLGLGDSTFNTQIYASLGTLFPGDETVAAFTVFQFVQNVGSAVGFYYSPYLPVHGDKGTFYQLIILAAVGGVSTLLFLIVNLKKRPGTK